MKILVTGATGQLGYDVDTQLKKSPRNIVRGVGSAELDITDEAAVTDYIKNFLPDAVIHCAAYTAVDRAEDDAGRCYTVNTLGTRYIAEAVRETGGKMLYISTDYVFDGRLGRPYEITDMPNPVNVYGRTKLQGEQVIMGILEKYFIVRTAWIFGSNGNNFVKTMLRLGGERPELNVASDQIGSPSYTADLAMLIAKMVESDKYGLYHAANEGYCTWYEFAKAIFQAAGIKTRVNAINSAGHPVKAVRPADSRLSKKSLTDAGFELLPHWSDALVRFLSSGIISARSIT